MKFFEEPQPIHFPLLILIIVLMQWAMGYCISTQYSTWVIRGQFGDMYGAVNTLFSGMAFAGAVYAIIIQQYQITLQREITIKQSFESALFQMLNIHNSIVDSLHYGASKGRSVFQDIVPEFIQSLNIALFYDESMKTDDIKELNETYHNICIKYADMGNYFRYLYHIFKFIDSSAVNDDDKKKYTSIVRAQLSGNEQIMLYFNCLALSGVKFKPLVEKYSLLENMPPLLNDKALKYKTLYNKDAFGDNPA